MKKLEWTPPYKTKAIAYKSTVTGKVYTMLPFEYEGEMLNGYSNHGAGGIKDFVDRRSGNLAGRYMDLPADEYPYTYVYEDPELYRPHWLSNS